MTYDEEMKLQASLLDKYDFIPYLENCYKISDLIHKFEFDHDNDDLPSEFDGFVFNFFGEEDIIDYLSNRYPQYCFPEIITHVIQKK